MHLLRPGSRLRQTSLTSRAMGGASAAWTPAELGLFAWFRNQGPRWQDSARTVTVTANADPVGAWDDSSGNSRHATQATGVRRPTYRTSVTPAGLAVVRNAIAGTWLSSTFTAIPQPFTVVCLTRQGASTAANKTLFDSNTGGQAAVLKFSSTYRLCASGATAATSPIIWAGPAQDSTFWRASVYEFSGSSSAVRDNNNPDATVSPGTNSLTGLRIGADNAAAEPGDWDVVEMFVVSRLLTEEEKELSVRYLGEMAGVLPAACSLAVDAVAAGAGQGYNAFSNIVKLTAGANAGKILLTYNDQTADPNQDAIGKATISADGGLTWSTPTTVSSLASHAMYLQSTAIWDDGTVFATIQKATIADVSLALYWITTTDGVTWSTPTQMLFGGNPVPAGYNWVSTYGTARQVSASEWRVPAYGEVTATGNWNSLVLRTTDAGATWSIHSVIVAGGAGVIPNETAILNTGGLNWLAAVRTENDQLTSTCRSTDGGLTWSALSSRGKSVSPHLLRLTNGDVLLSLGDRFGESSPAMIGIRCHRSTDGGLTWGAGQMSYCQISQTVSNVGYPCTELIGSGRVGLTYYYSNTIGNAKAVAFTTFPETLPI